MCDDGRVCPADTTCVSGLPVCATDEQLTICGEMSLADGTACPLSGDPNGGVCQLGVCVRALCGDGLVLGLEQCDGTLATEQQSCRYHGYYDDGPVTCGVDCRFDTSQCGAICGDHLLDPREACDPVDRTEVVSNCVDNGFYTAGDVRCNAACQLDVSSCSGRCGDGFINGPETCDGAPPGEISCMSVGMDAGQLVCGTGCFDSRTLCRDIDFTKEIPLGNNEFLDIWGIGTEFFAATSDDKMFHTTGLSWKPMAGPFNGSVRGIWGSSVTDVFAVGGELGPQYGIYHYDGVMWTLMTATPANPVDLYDVWGTGPNDVWAVGQGSTVLHYDGATWTKQTTPITAGLDLRAVYAAGVNDVFVGGYYGGIGGALYHYNGTWVNQTPSGALVTQLYGRSGTDIYAIDVGQNRLYHYNGSWTQVTPGCTYNGGAVTYDAVGGLVGGAVVVSGWPSANVTQGLACWLAGGVWHAINLGTIDAGVLGAVGGSERRLYVGGRNAAYRTDGTTFLPLTALASPPSPAMAVWGSTPNNLFVVGKQSNNSYQAIVRWNGTSWTQVAPQAAGLDIGTLYDIAGGPGLIAAAGTAGRVLTSSTGNAGSWTVAQMVTTGEKFNAVWVDSTGTNAYAVGDGNFSQGRHSLVAHFNGGSWTSEDSNITDNLNAVWGSGTSVFAVGEKGQILRKVGNGAWTAMTSGTTGGLSGIWGRSETDVFVVGSVALHYDGVSWSRIAADGYMSAVWGTATDIYASANQRLFHYVGGRFLPIRPPDGARIWHDLTSTSDILYAMGDSPFDLVALTGRWTYPDDATETECTNGWDDDLDNTLDCADSDCAAAPECAAGGVCNPTTTVACGQSVSGTTVGGTTWWPYVAGGNPSVDESGTEAFFRVTRPTDGAITVKIKNYTANLDLAVSGMTGAACTPDRQVLGASQTSDVTETVTFTATANSEYIAIVDGQLGASGAFTLEVTCP